MLPDAAYPGPLPLSRRAALDLLGRPGEFDAATGTFLTFVEIPVEERIGEWRFAGAGRSLAEAVGRAEQFAAVMGLSEPEGLLRRLLETNPDTGYDHAYSYPRAAPRAVSGLHRLVLCVRSGAPYEGLGVGIVEVETLAGSSFAGVAPETEPPKGPWDAGEE
jgi:hypothetical protein